MNVFNDVYIGQPHSQTDITSGVWTGTASVTGTYTGRPVGAMSGNLYLTSGLYATSATTGALQIKSVYLADGTQVEGGAGIAGNLWVNRSGWIGTLGSSTQATAGNLVAASSVESTDGATNPNGSFVALGGAGIKLRLNVGGNIVAQSSIASTSKTTGAVVITGTGGLGVGGGITAGNIRLDASGTSQESLLIPQGSLLTTPKVGAIEHSTGGIWYATPFTSSRALMGATHFYAVNGNAAINNATSPVASTFYGAFGGTGGTAGALTVAATTTYEVEARLVLAATGGAIPTGTVAFTWGGTATISQYDYQVISLNALSGDNGITPAATTPNMYNFFGTTALPTVTTGVVVASTAIQNRTIMVKGIIRTNATGTLIPQVAVTGTWSPVVLSSVFGSYWKATPIGDSATVSVGAFSAT
jgi:hypothetical protein